MSSQLQALVGTWAMAAVGLLNAFIPGITDIQQTALTAFVAVTVSLALVIFNRSAPDTIDKDPAADFERARVRLARHAGLIMPSIEQHTGQDPAPASDPLSPASVQRQAQDE